MYLGREPIEITKIVLNMPGLGLERLFLTEREG